jgi:toxin ParE1/3/4
MKLDHKYALELSKEAFDDLVNIQNYTYSVHDENQWEIYEDLLDKAMLQILNNPFSGHVRNDMPKDYQARNVGEHVMIYRVAEDTIYLVRALHGSMDFSFHFGSTD